jgi:hypothetical protein|tara:strand:- start:77 stop:436 length:360 start_codon:yes stop_codon:yes gene_type:complete
MNVLTPVTSNQELKIIPRGYRSSGSDYTVILTEDGTGKTQTLTSVSATQTGNYMVFTVAFSILSNNSMYTIEIQRDNLVKFRGKIYCSDRTSKKRRISLNTSKYTEHSSTPSGTRYITV